jgi:hypothetical protein
MGAWSEENFGNDDACDWAYDLEKSKGTEVLMSPINTILINTDYLEAPECCTALAAAEVIVASITKDYSRIPENTQKWLNKKQGLIFGSLPEITKEHALLAKQAVEKILIDSELKELWQETEDFTKWQDIQKKLIQKLISI